MQELYSVTDYAEGHAADSVEGMSSVYISGPEAPRVAQPDGDVGY